MATSILFDRNVQGTNQFIVFNKSFKNSKLSLLSNKFFSTTSICDYSCWIKVKVKVKVKVKEKLLSITHSHAVKSWESFTTMRLIIHKTWIFWVFKYLTLTYKSQINWYIFHINTSVWHILWVHYTKISCEYLKYCHCYYEY